MSSRSSLCFVSLLLLAGSSACNSSPKEGAAGAPPVAAAVQARAALVTPTLGGSVVAVGDRQLELAVLENGSVLGQVYDASGAALAAAELPKVRVDLRTQGGGRAGAELRWQPAQACLAGRAQLSAGLVAEPIDVALELAGKVSTATLSGYAILPLARFGGSVLAVGPHAVELVAQGNTVLAYVLEASGQARAGAELALQLELGGAAPLALTWDAQRGAYRAQLDGKLDLAAQPLQLTLTAAGQSFVGAARSLSAVAKARADVRAQLSAAGQAQAQLDAPALDVSAKAGVPGASLKAAASAGASKLAAAKLSASKAVSAKVSAQAPSLKVSKSASGSASVKKPSAKASASAKAGASFSFGK